MANTKQAAVYPPKVRRKWYFLVEKAGKTVNEFCGVCTQSQERHITNGEKSTIIQEHICLKKNIRKLKPKER